MKYAGVGSRDTPESLWPLIGAFAHTLGEAGWLLRSGAADGADAAFEAGLAPHHAREIWLPKRGFNGHRSTLLPSPEAFELAARVHPAWPKCSWFARQAHARNGHQVLGAGLDDPIDMLVCWTPGGRMAGGTAQALRLASLHGIPVFNLGLGDPERVLSDALDFAHTQHAAMMAP